MDKLFSKMENITNRYVKFYKEDFEQDKKCILEMLDENNDTKYEQYLFWIIRKNGTNLGYKSTVPLSATYSYYLSDIENNGKDNRYYEIDLKNKTVSYIRNPFEYLKNCKLDTVTV